MTCLLNFTRQVEGLPYFMIPPPPTTKRRIKGFTPFQLGKVLAVLYGVMGLLIAPIFLLMSVFTAQLPEEQRAGMAMFGVGFAIAVPFIYGALGFIIGVLGAVTYNAVAKRIGGIEVEVE